MVTVNEKMTAIADAIRERTDEIEPLTLDDMATDVSKVYEAGKKSQYDEFWDKFQDFGNRPQYTRAFQYYWDDELFNPKYDLRPTGGAGNMFAYSSITDLAAALEKAGVVLDTSNATSISELVSYSTVNHLPEISAESVTKLSRAFASGSLVTIDKIILRKDGENEFSNTFQGCTKLANITIAGVIGNDISFSDSSNLTYESLMSIINALKDYEDTGETRTLTLHKTAKAKLSETDIAIATQKGWTVA